MKLTREKALQKVAKAALQGQPDGWAEIGRVHFGWWDYNGPYFVEIASRDGTVEQHWEYKTTRGAVNHIVKLLMADAR